MGLEATLICVDNSEYMRNADFLPSRIASQQDAVALICDAKTQQHPESAVGILSMAGRNGVKVLVTPTQDIGRMLKVMHTLQVQGKCDVSSALAVAQLALKHRQNKNQRQRIILFVGSPIVETTEALVKIGKKMKKNNVACDVVNFGEETQNTEKLEAFIAAVNKEENSHLLTIPAGLNILSDVIMSSAIISDGGGHMGIGADGAAGDAGAGVGGGAAAAAGAGAGAGAGGGGAFDFGVDPNIDPELALALRMSMEEERARQAASAPSSDATTAAAGAAAGGDNNNSSSSSSSSSNSNSNSNSDSMVVDVPSNPFAEPASTTTTTTTAAPPTSASIDVAPIVLNNEPVLPQQQQQQQQQQQAQAGDWMDVDQDEEEMMRLALEMSMTDNNGTPSKQAPPTASTSAPATDSAASAASSSAAVIENPFSDEEYFKSVMASLPGISADDPRVQQLLKDLAEKKQDDDKNKK